MIKTVIAGRLASVRLATAVSIIISALIPLGAAALDVDTTVGLESLVFTEDGARPDQFDSDTSASVELELNHSFNDGNTLFNFTPYGRWDSHDNQRRHADIRELTVIQVIDDVEALAGISKVFWGVTESAHLVDIINQTDYLEGFDGEDKLGQPMLRVSKSLTQSTLSGFILPRFRERAFLSQDNPLSLPFAVNDDESLYDSAAEESHVDVALRYNGYFGSVDYGLSVFDGTSRDPVYVAGTDNRMIPLYQQITQYGIDLQLTRGAWLWKLETIYRDIDTPLVDQRDFSAAVGGFEYSFYGVADGDFDLGLIVEYHHDSRNDRTTVAFQNELFLGGRLGFTDVAGTELLAGTFIDLDDESASFRVEASRRVLGDSRLSLDAQAFTNVDSDNLFAGFSQSDFIRVTLETFF